MVIELRGVDFVNKGGELMLHAVVAKLRNEMPDVLFVMEKSKGVPRRKLLEYKIYTKTNFNFCRIPFGYISAVIPVFLRRHLHFINENEINVVLDASGFAFGEVWGAKKALARLGNHISEWRKAGKKVILLPQAFGPFIDPQLIAAMNNIVKNADLIFVRDKVSHVYLSTLAIASKFNLAPDFTNLIEGIVPSYFDRSACEVAIIVNSKMIETRKGYEGEAYLNLLERMIIMINSLGHKPYFLIHEMKMDRNVAEAVNERLVYKLPILQEDDPIYVKGIIATSKAVVSSRYHGLVSCLSQGVPCLATGWSHKYRMLLKDYNYPEGMLDVTCDDETLLIKLKAILIAPASQLLSKRLKIESAKQKQLSEQMWQKVLTFIKSGNSSGTYFTKQPLLKKRLVNKET